MPDCKTKYTPARNDLKFEVAQKNSVGVGSCEFRSLMDSFLYLAKQTDIMWNKGLISLHERPN